MFEKRHLCAVADLIARGMPDLDESGREYVAEKLAELFESHNPRFKPSVFYKAADVRAPWERYPRDNIVTRVNAARWRLDEARAAENRQQAARVLSLVRNGA